MATILTKKSDTASAVPLAADLTNAAGGAELAVNATDKRLFSKTSGGTVVELGTNPSTLVLPSGSANGVAYLNGSKVVTSGSALTFNGTNVSVGNGAAGNFEVGTGGYGYIVSMTNVGPKYAIRSVNNTDKELYINDSAGGFTKVITYIDGSEATRLTATGLGIGTSSPSSKLTVASTGSTIELKQNGTGAATYYVMDNTIETGGKRWRFGYTGGAGIPCFSLYNQTDNVVSWVADASGNLGLGVTPSAWNGSLIRAIQIGDNNGSISSFTTGNTGADWLFLNNNAYYDGSWKYTASSTAAQYAITASEHRWLTAASGTAGNAITFTQALTLDSSQNLLIGTTTTTGNGAAFLPAGSGGGMLLRIARASEGTAHQFAVNSNVVGSIYTTASATTYNTSSDYRLKNITGPVTTSGAYIDSLNPVEGTWKADGSTFVGLIAHEVQEASRTQVATGTKDGAEMQAMDYSSPEIISNLIAEVKSVRKRLADAGL